MTDMHSGWDLIDISPTTPREAASANKISIWLGLAENILKNEVQCSKLA